MGVELGPAVLRIQADEASANDLRLFVQEIVDNEQFRKRCRTMGNLVLDIGVEDRQFAARHCLTIMWSWAEPSGPSEDPEKGSLVHYPLRGSKWWDHITRDANENTQMSAYLMECIRAIEFFWGVKDDMHSKMQVD